MGGLLASAYAVAHPEHVHTLILSDSAAPGFSRLHPRLEEIFPDFIAQTKNRSTNYMARPTPTRRPLISISVPIST
jgi:pimeloyl-ACP methyl ester carboxylesterase